MDMKRRKIRVRGRYGPVWMGVLPDNKVISCSDKASKTTTNFGFFLNFSNVEGSYKEMKMTEMCISDLLNVRCTPNEVLWPCQDSLEVFNGVLTWIFWAISRQSNGVLRI